MYCSIQDVRDEGVTEGQASDARVTRAIALATAFIDRATAQFFEPRTRTFTFDGPGRSTLFLSVPIIAITAITQGDAEPVDLTDLRIYNRHMSGLLAPDDRANPRIEWASRDRIHISPTFGRAGRQERWRSGTQSISITGTFGYVEPDGSTPMLIQEATILLALRSLPGAASDDRFDALNGHRVTSMRTRDQSVSYGPAPAAVGLALSTGDPAIDGLLAAYAAPIRIAAA